MNAFLLLAAWGPGLAPVANGLALAPDGHAVPPLANRTIASLEVQEPTARASGPAADGGGAPRRAALAGLARNGSARRSLGDAGAREPGGGAGPDVPRELGVLGRQGGAGQAEGGRGHSASPWTAIVAAALVAVAFLLLCYGVLWLRNAAGAEGGPARREAGVPKPVSYLYRPAASRSQQPGSAGNLESTSRLSTSVIGDGDEASSMAPSRESSPGRRTVSPLCQQLVVPERSKLQCVLPDTVTGTRQELIVSVCSVAARGGLPLFQARVAEQGRSQGIHLETLRGEEQLAFLSTQELWAQPQGREPRMDIMRASGIKYATMTKGQGIYTITSPLGPLMVFNGDFEKHDLEVRDTLGQLLAEVGRGSGDGADYVVTVFPCVDSGLVILGLLAIDKQERHARA